MSATGGRPKRRIKLVILVAVLATAAYPAALILSPRIEIAIARFHAPHGISVGEATASGRKLLSCVAAEFDVLAFAPVSGGLPAEIGDLGFPDTFRREMFETTASWGRACLRPHAVAVKR